MISRLIRFTSSFMSLAFCTPAFASVTSTALITM
jgi:hypothetical protein